MAQFLNPRHTTWTKDNVITEGATVTCKAGQFTQIGTIRIVAGIAEGLGYGNDGALHSAIGRAYASLKDNKSTPGDIDGVLKISIMDESFSHLVDVAEIHTRNLRTTRDDLTKQMALPYARKVATQDKYIRFEFKPDGAGDVTLSKANSEIYLSATKWTVRLI